MRPLRFAGRRFLLLAALAAALALPAQAPAALGPQKFGIAAGGDIQDLPQAQLERELDVISSAGSRWLRIDVNWAQIQAQGAGSYNWSATDRVISEARERGLRVLGVIVWTPSWARPAGTQASHGPDPQRYAAFARQVVRRYAPRGVHHWEVWNEPNVAAFWTPKPNAAAYAKLLKAAYRAIKDEDPNAVVLTGGTAPAVTDEWGVAPVAWLKRLYRNGAKGSFDAVAHHPYCWPAFPGEAFSWSAWHQMSGAAESLRSVMKANGNPKKKVWATEFGAPTGGPAGSFVSEATQAQMIRRAYELWGGYGWAGPLFVYEARDHGTSASTRENFFGLVRHDFSAKPAYGAYRQLAFAAQAGPAQPSGPSPAKQANHLEVRIGGTQARPVVSVRLAGPRKGLPRMVALRLQRRQKARWVMHSPKVAFQLNNRGQRRLPLRRLRSPLAKGAYRVRAVLDLGAKKGRLVGVSRALQLKRRIA